MKCDNCYLRYHCDEQTEFICKHNDYCKYIESTSTGVISQFESVPVISIPALISWLNDQKYTNVDETSGNMTEEFEREHQWELSRNCFINKMIKKLKEV